MLKSIKHILLIARYERMMLYRTARFWILAGAGILGALFFIIAPTAAVIFDSTPPPEFFLNGSDAYLTQLFYGFVQVILVIFVAANFHKAEIDARLDQVMLSRPLTTLSLVLGKYFGVVSAVLLINGLLLGLAMIGRLFKMYFAGTDLSLVPALIYLGLVSLPAVMFMTAFVFFIISLLRSQVLAIILPLGFATAVFFWLHHDYLGLFDFSAAFAPLFAGDLIGFGEIRDILLQRLFFFFLAGAMLMIAVLRYPRLHQSAKALRFSCFAAILFLAAAAIPAGMLISEHHQKENWKRTALAENRLAREKAFPVVTHYAFDLRFAQQKTPLHARVSMAVANRNTEPLQDLIFSLNSSLQVSTVRSARQGELRFAHDHNLLTIAYPGGLQPGASDTLIVHYHGSIDAETFQLDRMPELGPRIRKTTGPWLKGNMSAWLSKKVAVLPYESGWYPVPGPASGYDHTQTRARSFATADFTLQAPGDIRFITQGERTFQRTADNVRVEHFRVKKPVPGFSINYGPYRRLAWQLDAAEVELFILEEHLPDLQMFNEVADTCRQVVEELFTAMEAVSGTAYPWPRLSFVEVPLQMQVWPSASGIENILVQPGVVMIDELRILKHRMAKLVERRQKIERRRGRDDSAARIKRDVFIRTVLDLLFPKDYWIDGTLNSPVKNYLHFQVDITDPLLARALEMMLQEQTELRLWDTFFVDRRGLGISSNDRLRQLDSEWTFRHRYNVPIDSVITLLTRVPLREISPRSHGRLYHATVDFKAPPVLLMFRERIGEKNWQNIISGLISQRYGQEVTPATLLDLLPSAERAELADFFADWFGTTVFPGYQLTQASAVKVKTSGIKTAYQVRIRVRNGEKGEGFVRLRLRTRNDTIWRNLALGSYEEKEILIGLFSKPRDVTVVPYFSRNRGQLRRTIDIAGTLLRTTLQDTAYTVMPTAADSLVFFLDDQDEGFFTPIAQEARYLRPPARGSVWSRRTHPLAFGKYYFGWHVKKGGEGEYPVRWQTRVPRSGDYQISYYLPVGRTWYTRSLDTITLYITTAHGREKVVLHPQVTADSWQPLGRFFFKADQPAIVEVADTGHGYVVVDALRWEYIE